MEDSNLVAFRGRHGEDVPYRALAEWARRALNGDYDRMAAANEERREMMRERRRAS